MKELGGNLVDWTVADLANHASREMELVLSNDEVRVHFTQPPSMILRGLKTA